MKTAIGAKVLLKQVKQLDAFIQELPTKYGLPLTQFLSKLAQEQNPEEVKAETDQAVFDFCFRDRFAYCTTQVNGKSGLTRIDLSEQISPLRFAYAHDVFTADSTNATTACAFMGETENISFAVASNYVYVQSATDYVTSGYLQSQ